MRRWCARQRDTESSFVHSRFEYSRRFHSLRRSAETVVVQAKYLFALTIIITTTESHLPFCLTGVDSSLLTMTGKKIKSSRRAPSPSPSANNDSDTDGQIAAARAVLHGLERKKSKKEGSSSDRISISQNKAPIKKPEGVKYVPRLNQDWLKRPKEEYNKILTDVRELRKARSEGVDLTASEIDNVKLGTMVIELCKMHPTFLRFENQWPLRQMIEKNASNQKAYASRKKGSKKVNNNDDDNDNDDDRVNITNVADDEEGESDVPKQKGKGKAKVLPKMKTLGNAGGQSKGKAESNAHNQSHSHKRSPNPPSEVEDNDVASEEEEEEEKARPKATLLNKNPKKVSANTKRIGTHSDSENNEDTQDHKNKPEPAAKRAQKFSAAPTQKDKVKARPAAVKHTMSSRTQGSEFEAAESDVKKSHLKVRNRKISASKVQHSDDSEIEEIVPNKGIRTKHHHKDSDSIRTEELSDDNIRQQPTTPRPRRKAPPTIPEDTTSDSPLSPEVVTTAITIVSSLNKDFFTPIEDAADDSDNDSTSSQRRNTRVAGKARASTMEVDEGVSPNDEDQDMRVYTGGSQAEEKYVRVDGVKHRFLSYYYPDDPVAQTVRPPSSSPSASPAEKTVKKPTAKEKKSLKRTQAQDSDEDSDSRPKTKKAKKNAPPRSTKGSASTQAKRSKAKADSGDDNAEVDEAGFLTARTTSRGRTTVTNHQYTQD